MLTQVRVVLAVVWLAASPCAFAASPAQLPTQAPANWSFWTADSPGGASSNSPSVFEEKPIDWHTLVPDIYHQQEAIWAFPFKLLRGEHWEPSLAVGATLGGLIALDPYDTPYFRKTSAFSSFNKAFPTTATEAAIVAVPVGFYGLGLVRKNVYDQHTAMLAGEAMVDTEILDFVLKNATGRRRPENIPVGGNYADTWFEKYHPYLRADPGFPSGHAIEAFSVATIFVHRYPTHRWLPWLAYGAAAVISFSRITTQQHFPSDVFAGAAFGYIVSRYLVMPGREPEQ